MNIAGPLPTPNKKIATGNHATGETGASNVTVGRTNLPNKPWERITIPMQRLAIAAMASPASTRILDDAIVMITTSKGVGPGIGIDADLPAFGDVEILNLSGEITQKNVGRRQQPMIGDVDVPEGFPKAGEESDRKQAPAELRSLPLDKSDSLPEQEEPNPGESATLRSSPIFMLVAVTGSGGFIFELGVDVGNLGDRLFHTASRSRALPRIIAERDADVAILAGAPLAGLASRARDRIHVPVIDPIVAAVKQAEALIALGAAKPRSGFKRPAPKSSSIVREVGGLSGAR